MNHDENLAGFYGLYDEDTLKVAVELAPELFTALHLATSLPKEIYPIMNDDDLEHALTVITGGKGSYDERGITIERSDCRDRFPIEFLPVNDQFDLIRKVYLAIVIAHETEARKQIEAAKSGQYQFHPSHPFDLEVLP